MTPATSRDPVCAKDIDLTGSAHHLQHRGLTFHFCSRQCLLRFQETPDLYTGGSRNEEQHPILKRRRLRITGGDDAEIALACASLKAMNGIKTLQQSGKIVTVEYDLRLNSLPLIEKVITDTGLTLKAGLHSLQRSLWRFTERNEALNAAHAGTGACCSRPPSRLR